MHLALRVCSLDDGEEADAVIALLIEAGVASDWEIERPNKDSNAVFLPIELDDDVTEDYQIRQKKLEIAVARLRNLRPGPIAAIRELFGLDTEMRISTSEFYLPLDSDFVRECGRLGLEICIFNEAYFSDQKTIHRARRSTYATVQKRRLPSWRKSIRCDSPRPICHHLGRGLPGRR